MAENKKRETTAAYNALCEKANRTNSELSNVSEMVRKLKTAQNQCKTTIDNLKDKLESREATSVDIFVSSKFLLKTMSVFCGDLTVQFDSLLTAK